MGIHCRNNGACIEWIAQSCPTLAQADGGTLGVNVCTIKAINVSTWIAVLGENHQNDQLGFNMNGHALPVETHFQKTRSRLLSLNGPMWLLLGNATNHSHQVADACNFQKKELSTEVTILTPLLWIAECLFVIICFCFLNQWSVSLKILLALS